MTGTRSWTRRAPSDFVRAAGRGCELRIGDGKLVARGQLRLQNVPR